MTINNSIPKIFITTAIITLYCLMYYPGLMSPDSQAIYASAISNSYGNHHPPIMAFVWHLLLYLHHGTAGMFLLNMLLLWSGMFFMIKSLNSKTWKYACLLIPFIPQIAVYAGYIWKDIIFSFGFLCLSMWISYKDIIDEKFSFYQHILFLGIAFYVTGVKYQAQFILPILLFWYTTICFKKNPCKMLCTYRKRIITTIFLSFFILKANDICSKWLISSNPQGNSNSWQFKKIYDLSGISIYANKIVVPDYLVKTPPLRIQQLVDNYELAWEPLIVYPHSPLKKINNNQELQQLHRDWLSSIYHHPVAYLRHRATIFIKGLTLPSPVKGLVIEKFPDYPVKYYNILRIFAYIFILPMHIYLLYFGSRQYLNTQSRYSKSILFMSIMGLSLLFLLLFFSLASVPRYIYFTNVMFFASLPFWFAEINTSHFNKK